MTRFLALAATLMLGVMAGFFYAFSVTVMPGLDNSDPTTAVQAMQGINMAVRNPVFFATFFLSPVIALAAAMAAFASGCRSAATWLTLAGLTYIGAAISPTALVNVPMNNALALLTASDATSAIWRAYSVDWTMWNHARTIATLFASGLAAQGWRKL